MRLFLVASVVALAAAPVQAADGDFRTGTFTGALCGARATFEIEEKYPDAWVFRGNILIQDTNEYDAIRIVQFDDNSLRITRELRGANFGLKQTVETAPPVIEEGNVVFYSQTGSGPGCNNPGANTALRVPLEPTYEFEQFEVVGQSPKQCQRSMALCTNSIETIFGANAETVIAEKCAPLFQACMGNAQVAANQFDAEFGVEGKTPDECVVSSRDCEARVLAEGYDANAVTSICAPRLQVCMGNAQAAISQFEDDFGVVGKTPDECVASSRDCEARVLAEGYDANAVTTVCAPRLEVCMANAEVGDGDNDDGGGREGTIVANVTGYDSWDAPNVKCYLTPGAAVILLETKPDDPNWKHLQGVEEVCDGEDFYLYDEGQLGGL